MKRTLKHISLVLALVAGAFATVTFDPTTGIGFVGKGDVQLAFGWNNPQVQANAQGVSFTYSSTNSYTAVCTWTTGEGTRGEQTHNVSHTRTLGVNDAILYNARVHQQIDGFNLIGFASGTPTESGTFPVVGGACPGNPGTDGVWTSVSPTGSSSALYTNYNGISVKIWPPAI
jgi:hypothetical protein